MPQQAGGIDAMGQRLRHRLLRLFAPERLLRSQYLHFRTLLEQDGRALELLTELDSFLSGENPADICRIRLFSEEAFEATAAMSRHLQGMNPTAYRDLDDRLLQLRQEIEGHISSAGPDSGPPYILSLAQAADHPELAGGKAANLSSAGRAGIRIPAGFVITANALHRFMAANGLEEKFADRFRQATSTDQATLVRVAGELQELIMQATVPEEIAGMIVDSARVLSSADRFAVRSSALAEDGEISFAGQYVSELDVAPDDLVAAYKRVIAGKYCPRAIAYRINHGLSDADTAMAALVVEMLSPRVSGVVYSRDPAPSAEGVSLGVYAVPGLASGLVDGSRTPEKYHLSRSSQLYSCENQLADTPLLAQMQLLQLKDLALELERLFGCPQDIEWAIDDTGLIILQSRRLHQQQDPPPVEVVEINPERLLGSNLHCAAPGIACGPVFFAPLGKTFRDIPEGSVVITPALRPSLSQFLDRIAGVIAESGSRASHFACVARERGVPVLVGKGIVLCAGQMVTVDAASGRIFDGCIETILEKSAPAKSAMFPVERFAPLVRRTTRLQLDDPDAPTFTPEHCRSLHDIVRFCHEMAVREMFGFGNRKGRGMSKARRLDTSLPLAMYVLDLDREAAPAGTTFREENLSSLPLRALWRGLADDRVSWDPNLLHLDWEEFDRISGGIFALDDRILASYAIVSEDYIHLDIRFGYHFSIVDAVCSGRSGANYINFRFKGGGAALEQRLLRLEFLDRVLSAWGFETSRHGDALDATCTRLPRAETALALSRLGLLLAATRLMDMKLTGHDQALREAEEFLGFADQTAPPPIP